MSVIQIMERICAVLWTLFRMDQEKREEIYEAVKHDMEFMDKRSGKRKIQPGK